MPRARMDPRLVLPAHLANAKKNAPRESSIADGCREIATQFRNLGAPVKATKIPGSIYGERSNPDLHVTIAGLSCWVEVKRPGKEPTSNQQKKLKEWRDVGAITWWVDGRKEFRDFLVMVLVQAGWKFGADNRWMKVGS